MAIAPGPIWDLYENKLREKKNPYHLHRWRIQCPLNQKRKNNFCFFGRNYQRFFFGTLEISDLQICFFFISWCFQIKNDFCRISLNSNFNQKVIECCCFLFLFFTFCQIIWNNHLIHLNREHKKKKTTTETVIDFFLY